MPDEYRIITRGQGPELVLLHGWAMHSGIWGTLVDALATEFRVNLVDLPGHGVNGQIPLSCDLNEVAALILSKVPPAAWLGWSLGGLLTLAAALQQPHKVQSMTLVAATPSFSEQADWDCGVPASAQQAFSNALEHDYEGTINQFCLQTFGADWLDEALHRLAVSSFSQQAPPLQVLQSGLQLLYNNNLLPDLYTLQMPTLFLGGLRDRTVRQDSLVRAAALMPDARSILIPAAGHAAFISHEEKFLKIVRRFLHTESTT